MRPAVTRSLHARGACFLSSCCVLLAALAGCDGSITENSQAPAGARSVTTTTTTPPRATSTPPSIFLGASPASVSSGATAVLTWSSTNASSCTASGGWSGSEPAGGSLNTGELSATTTYTLSCAGPGGNARRSVTINVDVVTVGGSSCSAASGALMLRAMAVRRSGISPLLVFFDATATSSGAVTGNSTPFQDVSYRWSFGDSGSSGTGSWMYGANTSPNSKNSASGPVAAHLYLTSGSDTSYTVTVSAFDGANSASCQLQVSAYDPAGPNGFPGTRTTCVSNLPADSSGCPLGARLLQTQNIADALESAFASNRRVLFHCGDKFAGSFSISSGVSRASIGAYGGCEGSTSSRPIFQNSSGSTLTLIANNPTDIRIADIDFEDGTHTAQAIATAGGLGETQITLYNLNCSGMNACYYLDQATQSGVIASTATSMGSMTGTYLNFAGNNCVSGSLATGCSGSGGYRSVDYNALLGSGFDGHGAASGGSSIDTVRIAACRLCVISNNTFQNANSLGAVLKLYSGNTAASQSTWLGQYTELVEVSDNLFTGTAGAQLVETAPQSALTDERLRNVVVERNLFLAVSGGFGRQLLVSAVNETVRDNIFHVAALDASPPQYGAQVAQRGLEPIAQYVELYNNTCYALQTMGSCAAFDGTGFTAPGVNSSASNTLFYNNGTTSAVVVDHGSGNSVGAGSGDSAADPLMTDTSGSFTVISDFLPTRNYGGGGPVPVWYDALGGAWNPTWSLGALHP